MHTKSTNKSYLKGRDENRYKKQTKNPKGGHYVMLFGFLSGTTNQQKSTKKGGIKVMKDTFINVFNGRTFFIVIKKNAPINLK